MRSSSRPLRWTSSAAIAVGSVMPWRISVVDSRTPNSPNRSISRARASASGAPGRSSSVRENRSTDSSIASSSARGSAASAVSAANSSWRMVRPVWASSPATATTVWHSPRILSSAR